MQTNNKLLVIFIILAGGFIDSSCNPQKKISGNYSYETECMGIELDGSQTLKAWGLGRNRPDAVEQAKKNAIRDILFKGINNGKTECFVKPLLFEVNCQEKHEEYFNKFFADKGGEYKNFISMADESIIPWVTKDRKPAGSEVTYGVIIRVLSAELKSKMISDRILIQ